MIILMKILGMQEDAHQRVLTTYEIFYQSSEMRASWFCYHCSCLSQHVNSWNALVALNGGHGMKPTRNGIVGCFSTFFLSKLETLGHSQQKSSTVCFLLYYFSNGCHTIWSGEYCRSCVVLLLYRLTSDFFMKINERTQTRLQDCRWVAKIEWWWR